MLLKRSVRLDIERLWDYELIERNTLHCTKKAQNKTRIGQWRLLFVSLYNKIKYLTLFPLSRSLLFLYQKSIDIRWL